jgi:hypothetical protein
MSASSERIERGAMLIRREVTTQGAARMQSPPASTTPSALAILAEIGGAIVGGAVLAALFYLGGGILFSGAGLGMGLLTVQILAAILGFGVGAAAGVALAGHLLGQRGSPWLALLGSVLVGVVMALALRYGDFRIDLFLWPVVAAPLVIAGAVVGYNARRRP